MSADLWRLGVGAVADAVLLDKGAHAVDVALERVEIDDEGRGPDIFERVADLGGNVQADDRLDELMVDVHLPSLARPLKSHPLRLRADTASPNAWKSFRLMGLRCASYSACH